MRFIISLLMNGDKSNAETCYNQANAFIPMNFRAQTLSLQERNLPYSKMVFPLTIKNRIKYGLWRIYTPLHPLVRNGAVAFKILTPPARRQNFLIGKLSPATSIETAVQYLVSKGYGNHFIAWKDEGEVVSLRRCVGFEYQYHLRIFADGEVRGHYEYTPECYPILHYKAIGQEARIDEFRELLGSMIRTS